MGGTSTKFTKDVIHQEVVKSVVNHFVRNTKSQKASQEFIAKNIGGDVNIGHLDLDETTQLSVTAIQNYKISETDFTDIANSASQALKQTTDSPVGGVSITDVSNAIKTTIQANFNINSVKKSILESMAEQKVIITDVKGNLTVGDVSLSQQTTLVTKEVSTSLSNAGVAAIIMEKLNLKNDIVNQGPVATLAKTFGLSVTSMVTMIEILGTIFLLVVVLGLIYASSGSQPTTRYVQVPPGANQGAIF